MKTRTLRVFCSYREATTRCFSYWDYLDCTLRSSAAIARQLLVTAASDGTSAMIRRGHSHSYPLSQCLRRVLFPPPPRPPLPPPYIPPRLAALHAPVIPP